MQIGSLFIKIGFQAENDKLTKINSSITALSTSFLALENLIRDSYDAMQKFVQSTIEVETHLKSAHEAWGLNPQEMQKWQSGGVLAGVGMSADDVASSIVSVQQNLSQLKLGLGNVRGFNFLGVSGLEAKNALDLLDKVSDRIRSMGKVPDDVKGQLTTVLQDIGITKPEGFYQLLEMSKSQRNALVKGLIVSPSELGQIDKLNVALLKFQLVLDKIRNSLVARVSPFLTQIIQQFSEYLLKHQGDIYKFFDRLIKQIVQFKNQHGKEIFDDIKNSIIKCVDAVKNLINGFKTLGSLTGILKALSVPLHLISSVLNALNKDLTGIVYDLITLSGQDATKWLNKREFDLSDYLNSLLDKVDTRINKETPREAGRYVSSLTGLNFPYHVGMPVIRGLENTIFSPDWYRNINTRLNERAYLNTPQELRIPNKTINNHYNTNQNIDIRSDNMKDAGRHLKQATYDAYYQHLGGDR